MICFWDQDLHTGFFFNSSMDLVLSCSGNPILHLISVISPTNPTDNQIPHQFAYRKWGLTFFLGGSLVLDDPLFWPKREARNFRVKVSAQASAVSNGLTEVDSGEVSPE